MRHVRMLGLCLIAMFAVTAVAASGASAAKFTPEWGQCVPTESGSGGHYGNAGCTAKVKAYHGQYLGAYEWYPEEVHPETGQGEAGLQDRIGRRTAGVLDDVQAGRRLHDHLLSAQNTR